MKKQLHTFYIFGILFILMLCTTSCQSSKGGNGCGYWGNQEVKACPQQDATKASTFKVFKKIEKDS